MSDALALGEQSLQALEFGLWRGEGRMVNE